jgi:hypothetical protein
MIYRLHLTPVAVLGFIASSSSPPASSPWTKYACCHQTRKTKLHIAGHHQYYYY